MFSLVYFQVKLVFYFNVVRSIQHREQLYFPRCISALRIELQSSDSR